MKLRLLAVLLLSSFAAIGQNIPTYVPSNGLMGWWPFNGNCVDESGNGYNGINSGAALTADRNGRPNSAYAFNGATSFIQIPGLNFQSGWTIGFWMKPDSIHTNLQFVIGLDCFSNFPTIGVSATSGLCGIPNNNLFLFDGVGTCNNIHYGGVYQTEQHTHVVYTKNQNIYRCYINGQLTATDTALGPLVYITSLYFGTRCGILSDPFGGTLDDIGVWNRALDSTEVRTLYESCFKSITVDVTDQTAVAGGGAEFTVASSVPVAGFQWQVDTGQGFQDLSNNSQYAGVNNDTLSILSITMMNHQYQYRCLVSWGACIDTSSSGTLTVNSGAGIETVADRLVRLYPSPADNMVFLEAGPALVGTSYRIVGLTGSILMKGSITGEHLSVVLEGFATGLYFFELENGRRIPFSVVKG